jgi:hypothetical protein
MTIGRRIGFLRRYFLLWHTVSTCHVPRSESEVAPNHDESRDRDLRNLARQHACSTRNCSGPGKPRISAVAPRRNLIPRLCAIGYSLFRLSQFRAWLLRVLLECHRGFNCSRGKISCCSWWSTNTMPKRKCSLHLKFSG